MKKLKKKNLFILCIILLIIISFGTFVVVHFRNNGQTEEIHTVPDEKKEENEMIIDENGLTFVRGILLVNKHHSLPRNFSPGEDPQALAQVNLLITEMRSLGFDICTTFSGFRSFERQEELYNGFVLRHGREEADRFSARPGHSEHQSGLAFDLRHRSGQLVTNEREANWISENAHRFGFIVRYPENSEHITGFIHEPWHIRYIGDKAEKIWKSGLTLEEFLGMDPAPTYLD